MATHMSGHSQHAVSRYVDLFHAAVNLNRQTGAGYRFPPWSQRIKKEKCPIGFHHYRTGSNEKKLGRSRLYYLIWIFAFKDRGQVLPTAAGAARFYHLAFHNAGDNGINEGQYRRRTHQKPWRFDMDSQNDFSEEAIGKLEYPLRL